MLHRLLTAWFRGPLGLSVGLEERTYKLGETIRLAVELRPRVSLAVKEGRVDLVCEERWAETYYRREPMGASPGIITRGKPLTSETVPKREVKEFKESFVHSSAVFVEDTQLEAGDSAAYDVSLEISEERPPHALEGKLRWSLVTKVEASDGRAVAKSSRLMVQTAASGDHT